MKKVDKKTLLRVWDYLKFYKLKFFGSILLTVAMTILNVLEPFIIGFAITEIGRNVSDMLKGVEGAGINYDYLSKVLIIYFVRALLFQATNLYSQLFMTDVVQDAMRDLRKDLSDKLNRLPIAYFDRNQFGDILSKVTNDVDSIGNALQQSLLQVLMLCRFGDHICAHHDVRDQLEAGSHHGRADSVGHHPFQKDHAAVATVFPWASEISRTAERVCPGIADRLLHHQALRQRRGCFR